MKRPILMAFNFQKRPSNASKSVLPVGLYISLSPHQRSCGHVLRVVRGQSLVLCHALHVPMRVNSINYRMQLESQPEL